MSDMTNEKAERSANELAEKFRKVIQEHFGNTLDTGTFQSAVDNVFVLALAKAMVSSENVVAFAKRANKENGNPIDFELQHTEGLFVTLLLSEIDREAHEELQNELLPKNYN